MSCKNCSNGCPASEVTGKNCDPVEAEDLVIEFENQSGDMFRIEWISVRTVMTGWRILRSSYQGYEFIAGFEQLKDAKECAETLKRSV